LAPGTASLALGPIVVAPGAVVPFDPTSPSAALLLMVSGALTFRVEAPMKVARRGEPGKPVPSEPEAVAANTEFTLRPGDSALFPPAIAGELRNDGDAEAVAWMVSIAIQAAAAGMPTP
jgi:quercetin dioxygenase-like cupin family protein